MGRPSRSSGPRYGGRRLVPVASPDAIRLRQRRRPATATPKEGRVRARFPTWAVVALGALAVGALSIAVTLAASDPDNWPGWLQPYHRWGWWSVLGMLAAAVALAAWQATANHPAPPPLPPRRPSTPPI